jgi:hypothetical protein
VIDDIRALLEAEPFRPFVLTVTGFDHEYDVEHPRQVTIPVHGETIHYRDRHREQIVIAVRHITTVRLRKERFP